MSEPDSPPQASFIKLLSALIYIYVVAYGGINTLPFVVGSWVDSGRFDLEATGLLGSAELVGIALASVGLAGLISRGRRKKWILIGVATAVVGHGVSALDPGFEVMLVARLAAGIGEGIVTAAIMAIVSGTPDPTRVFAQLLAAGAVLFAVHIGVAPLIIQTFGTRGMFFSMVIMNVAIIPLTAWIPDTMGASAQAAAASTRSPNRGLAILAIAALALMAVGQMLIWTISERMGVLAGLSAETIGVVLAVNNLVGLLGASAAVALGTRLGNIPPVAFALATFTASCVVMIEVNVPLPYIASNLAFGFAFTLFTPYILGALATLDRAGRWAARATGIQIVAASLGPVVGALLISERRLLSLLIIVSAVIGLGMLLPTLRFADRSIEDGSVSGSSES